MLFVGGSNPLLYDDGEVTAVIKLPIFKKSFFVTNQNKATQLLH